VDGVFREILVCQTADGREPFSEWLDTLDPKTTAIVLERIDRVDFGACTPVGEGVSALRIDFGPGYRIYFGQVWLEVHLIRGGSKKRQPREIAAAKEFWRGHGAT
jgi:putative addiction module killer protein